MRAKFGVNSVHVIRGATAPYRRTLGAQMNKPDRLIGLIAPAALLLVPSSLAASAQAASTLPTVTVTLAGNSSIAVSGTLQSGAVNLALNAAPGLKEPSPTLVLLKPGVTVAEVDAHLKTNMAPKDP